MSQKEDIRSLRLQKLHSLKSASIPPYPSRSFKNTELVSIVLNYDSYQNTNVIIAGRVISIAPRLGYKLLYLNDMTAHILVRVFEEQNLVVNENNSEISWKNFDLLDEGDIIEVRGNVTKTSKKQICVDAEKVRILSKTLLSKTRLYKKSPKLYLEIPHNRNLFERYERVFNFWEEHRKFLKSEGFKEVQTPILQTIPGGARAIPMQTHSTAYNKDYYLRTSQELYLKRLIGAGYQKIFEIGQRFRDEKTRDAPIEQMGMEFYWAYENYTEGRKFTQNLFTHCINKTFGRSLFTIGDYHIDMSKDWESIDFSELFKEQYDLLISSCNHEDLKNVMHSLSIKFNEHETFSQSIHHLWLFARKRISGPAFIINIPRFLSPFSKSNQDLQEITERFEPIIAGTKFGNGWSELNDPIEQRQRYEKEQLMRENGDKSAQRTDEEYIQMLEYGLPPTFGYGHTEKVFWLFEGIPEKEAFLF